MWRYSPRLRRSALNRPGTALGLEDTCRRSRVAGEFACWTPWARYELTATVWTLAIQAPLGASDAECALERTNPGLSRLWRKVDVAALAAGPKFKHVRSQNYFVTLQSAGRNSSPAYVSLSMAVLRLSVSDPKQKYTTDRFQWGSYADPHKHP